MIQGMAINGLPAMYNDVLGCGKVACFGEKHDGSTQAETPLLHCCRWIGNLMTPDPLDTSIAIN
jgi:hypothetical protein